jgi:hypothetical protein
LCHCVHLMNILIFVATKTLLQRWKQMTIGLHHPEHLVTAVALRKTLTVTICAGSVDVKS